MFWLQRKQRDLYHQNQDQRWDRERVDTEVKQEIPDMPAFSTPSKNMSPPRKASKSSPCSSGKSASSDPGSPWNKGSVSSETRSMTAELAATSKTPHRDKAPLASRCNTVRHVKFHSKHRSEHVKDRGLNKSTHGEASGQRQSRGILKSCSKMKHLFRKTNTEKITDSERLSGAETLDDFLGGTAALLHIPTLEKVPSESKEEEEEADDDICCSWQDTYRETTFPLSVSHLSSAAGGCCHSLQSPNSLLRTSADSPVSGDGYTLSPLLEQVWQPRVPLIPNRINRGVEACPQQTYPLPKRHRSLQTSPTGSFCHKQSTQVDTEENHGFPAYTLWTSKEPWRQSASGQPDSLNVSRVFGDIKEQVHIHECPAVEGGAAAAQSAQCLEDSSRLIICRPKQRLLPAEEEEKDLCRICHSGDSSPNNQLISPCLCSGSMKFIHFDCLMTWIKTKIESGTYLIDNCELCQGMWRLEPQKIDLNRFYVEHRKKMEQTRVRAQEEVAGVLHFRTLISRGLELRDVLPRPSPVTRVRIWPSFPLLIRMRLRRIRERRNASPESADT